MLDLAYVKNDFKVNKSVVYVGNMPNRQHTTCNDNIMRLYSMLMFGLSIEFFCLTTCHNQNETELHVINII